MSVLVVLALCLLLLSCTSQSKLIGDSTASLIWYRAQYDQTCQGDKPPKTCKELYLKLEKLRVDSVAASEAAKYGQLPKSALVQISAEVKDLK